MYKLILITFCCLVTALFSENDKGWIQELADKIEEGAIDTSWVTDMKDVSAISEEHREWAEEFFSKGNSNSVSGESLLTGKCSGQCFSGTPISDNPQGLYVFISFSVPQETWLSLSKELEERGGAFVLRGLPENSFNEFAQRLSELTEKGLNAEVILDPTLYQKYEVTHVPTFVVVDGDDFDKISGNISLQYALEQTGQGGRDA